MKAIDARGDPGAATYMPWIVSARSRRADRRRGVWAGARPLIAWLGGLRRGRRGRARGLLAVGVRLRPQPRPRARDHQGAGHDATSRRSSARKQLLNFTATSLARRRRLAGGDRLRARGGGAAARCTCGGGRCRWRAARCGRAAVAGSARCCSWRRAAARAAAVRCRSRTDKADCDVLPDADQRRALRRRGGDAEGQGAPVRLHRVPRQLRGGVGSGGGRRDRSG